VKRCPLILNVDDLWPESLFDLGLEQNSILARVGEPLARIAYHKVSALTPISPGYIETLTRKYKIPIDQIHVVKAGVDLAQFRIEKALRDDNFLGLYIGAFSPAYDFNQLIMAASILRDYDDIKIVVQGAGELASYLKQEVTHSKLKNISIVEKILSRKQVAEALSKADVLFLPLSGLESIELGISSKLYEYQAASKPIICCSSGHPGQYIRETNSGIVIRPGNYKEIAKTIIKLKNEPEFAATLGENGRRYVEDNLSLQAIGTEILEVFKKYV
jgi:glycosyltransferase involved in cell wall biosynthesis